MNDRNRSDNWFHSLRLYPLGQLSTAALSGKYEAMKREKITFQNQRQTGLFFLCHALIRNILDEFGNMEKNWEFHDGTLLILTKLSEKCLEIFKSRQNFLISKNKNGIYLLWNKGLRDKFFISKKQGFGLARYVSETKHILCNEKPLLFEMNLFF